MAVSTIRNVPDEVKDALAREARESGKSLQSYLLDVLQQRADLSRNRHLLLTLAEDMKRPAQPGSAGCDGVLPGGVGDLTRARRKARPRVTGR